MRRHRRGELRNAIDRPHVMLRDYPRDDLTRFSLLSSQLDRTARCQDAGLQASILGDHIRCELRCGRGITHEVCSRPDFPRAQRVIGHGLRLCPSTDTNGDLPRVEGSAFRKHLAKASGKWRAAKWDRLNRALVDESDRT